MLANISQLHDRIWTGGDLDPRDRFARVQLDNIIECGITHILDLRLEWTDEERVAMLAAAHNMTPPVYKHLGVDDDGTKLGPKFWDEGMAYVETVLDEDPDHSILIHCHMGVNRAPSLAGLCVMELEGGTGVEIWLKMREVRPIAWAIYMPEGLRHCGLYGEAEDLQEVINQHNKYGDMEKGIGRIRSLQSVGTIINGESLWDEL